MLNIWSPNGLGILTNFNNVPWFALDREALQRVIRSAQHINTNEPIPANTKVHPITATILPKTFHTLNQLYHLFKRKYFQVQKYTFTKSTAICRIQYDIQYGFSDI